MSKFSRVFFFMLLSLAFNSFAGSYLDWRIGYKTVSIKQKIQQIRIGYLKENPEKPFKGNILYYQGLGDSFLNHDPLFEVLINDGYRVISFDYMGQGGSSGSMNDTRIADINTLGDIVISALGNKTDPKYSIIGWSTGGLAAYRKAYYDEGKTIKSVIIIAPGIVPNYLVGEGLFNWPIDEITMRTLTNNKFIRVNDPHHDPISPTSPICVPSFALDLQKTAKKAQKNWAISDSIKGLVFLSGPNDTYVNAKKTRKVLHRLAHHFEMYTYKDALHEIDNEIPSISLDLQKRVLNFLNN